MFFKYISIKQIGGKNHEYAPVAIAALLSI